MYIFGDLTLKIMINMKKILLFFTLCAFISSVNAQNIQTHYDFGKDRGYVTTTVEMFKPDKLGNTFFFIDFDYGIPNQDMMSTAYFEIARVMSIKKTPFGIHGEYNGGFGKSRTFDGKPSNYSINNAWLGGVDYSWNAKDFSKGFSLKLLYKEIQKKYVTPTPKNQHSFQLTGVWYVNFLKGKMAFTGFADLWKEENNFFLNAPAGTKTDFVFLSEPQLWFKICSHFAIGGELELSNNFALNHGFMANPTLGVKWTF